MHYKLLLLALIITHTSLLAQKSDPLVFQSYESLHDDGASLGERMRTFDKIKEKTKGSPFLNDDFNEGIIMLKSNKNLKYPLRYNLYGDFFELKIEDEVKYLPGNRVKAFDLNNVSYYRCSELKNINLTGLCVTKEVDQTTVISRSDITLKEGYYNQKMDVGENFDTFLKVEDFFILKDNALHEANNKRDLYKIYNKKKIKSIDKKIKNETKDQFNYLVKMINHLNSY